MGAWIAAALVGVSAGCGLSFVGSAPAGDVTPSTDASSEGPAVVLPVDGAALGEAGEELLDASCAGTIDDPENCGACGHSCLGGTCAVDKCQPYVVVPAEPGACAVAVDATYLYWVGTAGTIRRKPLAGGATADVHATGDAVHDLAPDDDRIYWGSESGAGVWIFGTSTAGSFGTTGGARAIAKTAQGLYFVSTSQVVYRNRDLSAQIRAFNNNGSSPAIAVDATHAFWSAGQQLRRVVYGANNVDNVVTNLGAAPTSIVSTPLHVYFTTATEVRRATKAAGTGWVSTTLVTGETNISSLAVDDSGLYWIDLTNGTLRRAPLAGGAAVTLATTSPQSTAKPFPRLVALTATAVYFASTADGDVLRLAK